LLDGKTAMTFGRATREAQGGKRREAGNQGFFHRGINSGLKSGKGKNEGRNPLQRLRPADAACQFNSWRPGENPQRGGSGGKRRSAENGGMVTHATHSKGNPFPGNKAMLGSVQLRPDP
jgi:hypothetical protein